MNFVDKITVAGTRKRDDGVLIVDARCARTGIQLYAGYEVGRPDLATVKVFRSADEVFSKDTLASFAHRAVTNNHPTEAVSSDNWKDYAVGQTTDEVLGEAIYVRVPLMVSDAATIKEIEDGKRELSPGYTCDLDWTPGKTQNGEQFDAQQRKIRINHIAIVDRGRSGSSVRIGDSWGATPILDEGKKIMATKTMMFDGLPIEVTDVAETVILKLQKQLSDSAAVIEGHKTTVATKDTEIGKLTADLATANAAIPTGTVLDALVADRVAVIETASKVIKDFKPDGLSNVEIRRKVVAAKFGDEAIKDRSDDMISGMFMAVTKDTGNGDPFKGALQDRAASLPPAPSGDRGFAERMQRMHDSIK